MARADTYHLQWIFVVAILGLAPNASVAQSNTTLGTVIDVTQPIIGCSTNAIGDGTTNNYDAFNCRLNKFGAAGGVLFVPAGTFKISPTSTAITPVSVPPNVTIQGTGYGSVLSQPSATTQRFIVLRKYSSLKDIELIQQQPTPSASWTPNASYDWQVWVAGSGVNIHNVMLLNPYLGVLVKPETLGDSIGQVWINNLRGQPLKWGIMADRECDISRFEDIHFWPFWSWGTLQSQYESVVENWTQANGIGILLERNDNPFFSNIFLFKYHVGIQFAASTAEVPNDLCYGITSRPRVSGFDCDACDLGVYASATGTNGIEMNNLDLAAGSLTPIQIDGDLVSGTFSNLDTVASQSNVVRVTGDYDSIIVGNATIRSWNINALGFPAFQVVPGATGSVITVSNALYNQGHGGAIAAGTTVVTNAVTPAPGL